MRITKEEVALLEDSYQMGSIAEIGKGSSRNCEMIWTDILRLVKSIEDEKVIRELEAKCIERCVEIIDCKMPDYLTDHNRETIGEICRCIRSGNMMPWSTAHSHFWFGSSTWVSPLYTNIFIKGFCEFVMDCRQTWNARPDTEQHVKWLLQLLNLERWAYDPGYDIELLQEQYNWLRKETEK
jgi:hypothetical protein